MQVTEKVVGKFERVLKMKQAKKPGQYIMIFSEVPRDERLKTNVKGQTKVIAFIGGLCPVCGKEIFGDIEIGLETAYLACPNPDCAVEFKLGSNNASLELASLTK
jgi:hypothetical protein